MSGIDLPSWLSAGAALASLIVSGMAVYIASQSTAIAREQAKYAKQQTTEVTAQNTRAEAEKRAIAICLAAEIVPDLSDREDIFRRMVRLEDEKESLTRGDPQLIQQRWLALQVGLPASLDRPALELRHLGPDAAILVLRLARSISMIDKIVLDTMNNGVFHGGTIAEDYFDSLLSKAHRVGETGVAAFEMLSGMVAPLAWNSPLLRADK